MVKSSPAQTVAATHFISASAESDMIHFQDLFKTWHEDFLLHKFARHNAEIRITGFLHLSHVGEPGSSSHFSVN